MTHGRLVVELDAEERHVLSQALDMVGGPLPASRDVARLIGLRSSRALESRVSAIRATLERGSELSSTDWRTALLIAELAIGSAVIGGAWDWAIWTHIPDEEAFVVLRRLQQKVVPHISL